MKPTFCLNLRGAKFIPLFIYSQCLFCYFGGNMVVECMYVKILHRVDVIVELLFRFIKYYVPIVSFFEILVINRYLRLRINIPPIFKLCTRNDMYT